MSEELKMEGAAETHESPSTQPISHSPPSNASNDMAVDKPDSQSEPKSESESEAESEAESKSESEPKTEHKQEESKETNESKESQEMQVDKSNSDSSSSSPNSSSGSDSSSGSSSSSSASASPGGSSSSDSSSASSSSKASPGGSEKDESENGSRNIEETDRTDDKPADLEDKKDEESKDKDVDMKEEEINEDKKSVSKSTDGEQSEVEKSEVEKNDEDKGTNDQPGGDKIEPEVSAELVEKDTLQDDAMDQDKPTEDSKDDQKPLDAQSAVLSPQDKDESIVSNKDEKQEESLKLNPSEEVSGPVAEKEKTGTPMSIDKEEDSDSKVNDKQDDKPSAVEQEPEPEPEFNEEKIQSFKQTHAIVIPSYASWFNMKKIHKIEQESLPEFFKLHHPSKSPKIYVGYRNFMINAYRLNPNEYLTLTSCRRNLVGDVGTLMRVFKFLNKWGLINYQVNPQFKPSYNLEKLSNGNVAPLPYAGDYKVNYDTPRGLFPFESFKLNPDINVHKLKQLMGNLNGPISNDKDSGSKHLLLDAKESISSVDVSKKRSHEEEHEEDSAKRQKDDWTSEELKSLLQGLKLYKNDWYKISNEVGNKSPQECIIKFLKLPIEDTFNSAATKDLELLKYSSHFPVNPNDNPIIYNLVFMTQLVDSDVAKAASSRASKVIHEKILERIESLSKMNGDLSKKKQDGGDQEEDDKNDKEESDKKDDASEDDDVKRKGENVLKELRSESEEGESIKDINSNLFGILGAKSHLFACYEEREMHKLSNVIINQQLNKINLKLDKIHKLEQIYETERNNLMKQQEEVFVDRLNLTNATINITDKLTNLINVLENSSKDDTTTALNPKELLSSVSDIKSLLYKPAKSGLNSEIDLNNGPANGKKVDVDVAHNGMDIDTKAEDTPNESDSNKAYDSVKSPSIQPLSIQAPQTFKVWGP